MKKIRLTEHKLHNIIKESVRNVVNEAHGTPPNADIDKLNNLTYHNSYKPGETPTYANGKSKENNPDWVADYCQEIERNFMDIWNNTSYSDDRILKAISALAEKGLKLSKLYRTKMINRLGIDSDSTYERNDN